MQKVCVIVAGGSNRFIVPELIMRGGALHAPDGRTQIQARDKNTIMSLFWGLFAWSSSVIDDILYCFHSFILFLFIHRSFKVKGKYYVRQSFHLFFLFHFLFIIIIILSR